MDQWIRICAVEDIPVLGARVVERNSATGNIALFRNGADAVFALLDRCPHRGGPLSQGIVYGERVACPLHGWSIGLGDGCAVAPDQGCTPRFSVRVDGGQVFLEAKAIAAGRPRVESSAVMPVHSDVELSPIKAVHSGVESSPIRLAPSGVGGISSKPEHPDFDANSVDPVNSA